MGLRLLTASPILNRQQLIRQRNSLGTQGHAHFWQRAAEHPRRFLRRARRWPPDWPSQLCCALPASRRYQIRFRADLISWATVKSFMCTCRELRLSLRRLQISMASLAQPRCWAAGLAEVSHRRRIRRWCLTRTCGSWTANTSEETRAIIRARLRLFESTSKWGSLPPTLVISYTILIRGWIMACSGQFLSIRAA